MHRILEVLDAYSPDCRPSQVEPLGSAGGMSGAQFWRITAPRGTLCLRRWPPEHPTSQRLRFIHAVLEHAARHGIGFIPVPINTATGESFVQHSGQLWELAPWMQGTADYDRSPSVAKLQAALQSLAQFHIAVRNFAPPTAPGSARGFNAITRRLARLRELTDGGINELSRAITDTTWPELAPLARQFIVALPKALPPAIAHLESLADVRLPLQLCLRDIWHDHVLFTNDEVTGMVDFGAVDIDTPATDIARLLGSLDSPPPCREGLDVWQIGLAAYSAVRRLSDDELRAAKVLDTSGIILAGCNWIRWIYLEGRQFDDQAQVVERFRRITERVAKLRSEPPGLSRRG